MGEHRIVVPFHVELISSNQRIHWAVKAKRTKTLRVWSGFEARRLGIPRYERAVVNVWVHPGARTRKIDPPNYSDTVKALIDGLVDVRVLPDDTGQHVISVTYREGARWPRTAVEVLVRGL